MAEALQIGVNGTTVGHLEYYEGEEDYVFYFDEAYLADPDRPLLGQFFEDRRPNQIAQSGMPAWFANLLPADPLRAIVARTAAVANEDFALLRAIGGDLPGAVTATPAEPRLGPAAGAAHSGLPAASDPADGALRFSLAGLQLKLSLLRTDRGIVMPASGVDGKWIAKFAPSRWPTLPRVEHATLVWAAATGCTVCESGVGEVAEVGALPAGFADLAPQLLLARRFDRPGSGSDRVHMEDLAQVMDRPPGDPHIYRGSFEQLAAILRWLAPDDLAEYVRRVVFMVVSGNGDAHLKNWTVTYLDGRNASLSPAYDLVPTVLYLPDQQLALDLSNQRDFGAVTMDSFRNLAAAADVSWPAMRHWVIEAVTAATEAFSTADIAGLFTQDEIDRLRHHQESVPVVAEHR